MLELNKVYFEDCLTGMQRIDDKSIDMIFADLPYGTTACKWDTPIDLNLLWKQYERIIKNNGVILFTATQPFASILINSNLKLFKYDWVFIKSQAANFQLSKKMPLKKHEYVLVFYNKPPFYNPQMWKGPLKLKRIGKNKYQDRKSETYLSSNPPNLETILSDTYYPTTILPIFKPIARNKSLHPTQKPVELMEYLIKTYTKDGELVLDNVIGSGTTAIACINTSRNYIGFENDPKYYNICVNRIEKHKNTLQKGI